MDWSHVLSVCLPLLTPGAAFALCLSSRNGKEKVYAAFRLGPKLLRGWLRDAVRYVARQRGFDDMLEDHDQLEDRTHSITYSFDPREGQAAGEKARWLISIAKELWGSDYPQQIDLPGSLLTAGVDVNAIDCLLEGLPPVRPSFLLQCAKRRVQISNLAGKLHISSASKSSSSSSSLPFTEADVLLSEFWHHFEKQHMRCIQQGGQQEQQQEQELQEIQAACATWYPRLLVAASSEVLHSLACVLLSIRNWGLAMLPLLLQQPSVQHWSPAQVHELLLLAFQQPRSGAAALPHLTRLQQAQQLSWKQLQQLAIAAGRHGNAAHVLSLLPVDTPIPPGNLLLIAEALFQRRDKLDVDEQLLQLPAAQEWGPADVHMLIKACLNRCWEAVERLDLLVHLPGAKQLSLVQVQGFFSRVKPRKTSLFPPLLKLPAAAQLPAEAVFTAVQQAAAADDPEALQQLFAHPAAADVPIGYLFHRLTTGYHPFNKNRTLPLFTAHPTVQAAPAAVVERVLFSVIEHDHDDRAALRRDILMDLLAVQGMSGSAICSFFGKALDRLYCASPDGNASLLLPFLALPGAEGITHDELLSILKQFSAEEPGMSIKGSSAVIKALAQLPAAADVTVAEVADLLQGAMTAARQSYVCLKGQPMLLDSLPALAYMPAAAQLRMRELLPVLHFAAGCCLAKDPSPLLQLPAIQADLQAADLEEVS